MRFETIDCPGCGSTDYRPWLEVPDRFHIVPGQFFSIVRCNRCRLLFTNPRPDASSIGEFYAAEGYDPFISGSDRPSLKRTVYRSVRFFTMRHKAVRVSAGLLPGGRSLDVGCATGEMMLELRKRGFETFGVEPDPKAADYAKTRLGLTVWNGGVEAVPVDVKPFDLVTLWHVLEHVHDLPGTLARLHQLTVPGGRLAIAVPNPRSQDAKAYKAEWVAWDAPRHLYHFEPDVLLELLNRSGFRAERKGAVAFDAFYHCLLSDRKSATGLCRAVVRGKLSFLRGLIGGEGSSELYWAYREQT